MVALEQVSIGDLRRELLVREAELLGRAPPRGDDYPAAKVRRQLAGTSTGEIYTNLVLRQKVIYGTDDRLDLFEVTDEVIRQDADCVVAFFREQNIWDEGDTSRLQTKIFTEVMKEDRGFELCGSEKFRLQPIGAFCSGFLISSDLIATAAHCVSPQTVESIRVVFGYRMISMSTPNLTVPKKDVYRIKSIEGMQYSKNGSDWAVLRLERRVEDHTPAQLAGDGVVRQGLQVHVIGHPVGLPLKYAGNATIRAADHPDYFVANLDTYGGNSGSPVFSAETHEVIGILVRGDRDFLLAGDCIASVVCPTTGCGGEDSTKISELRY